jgi:hypothetical protein
MTVFALESVGSNLLHLVWEAALVGIAVIFAFSFALTATIRATEARTESRHAAVFSWSVLALLSYAAFAGSAILAVHVVVSK